MAARDLEVDFAIEVEFERGSKSPARVFRAMSDLIEACRQMDAALLKSFHVDIQPVLLLEDIEVGSLRAWLRNVLNSIDEDALKNLDWRRMVGGYLVRGKKLLVEFTAGRTEIGNRSELEDLSAKIQTLAESTDIQRISDYAPPTPQQIANSLYQVSSAVTALAPTDRAKYVSGDGASEFNLSFAVTPASIETILTNQVIQNNVESILKIKKPDYLGDSMWEFRHENRIVLAKVVDAGWLSRFRRREFSLLPGDAIRVRLFTETKYGHDGDVVAEHHEVRFVKEVITGSIGQLAFLPDAVDEPEPES